MASSNSNPPTNPNPNPNPNNNIPSLRTIEAALSLVETKKQTLKRAYETLISIPSSSSSVPFSWSQLDSHFTSLHRSLSRRFNLLLHSYDSPLPLPHPELLSACRTMDGIRLRGFVNGKDLDRGQLVGCIREAPDPGRLVLDAVEGFCGLGLGEKKGCVVILEALREVEGVREGERERAKRIGVEWRDLVVRKKGKRVGVEALGLLNLVAAFRLGGEFDSQVLVECFVSVCENSGAPRLCKDVGLGEQANVHLIQRLINTEMEQNAIKFICVLGLADKFPPVPILSSWLEKVNKQCDECYKDDTCTSSTKEDAVSKAINSMTEALSIIDEFKLQYPKAEVEKRLEILQKRKEVPNKQKADGLLGSSTANKIHQQNERPGNQNEQKNEQPKRQNEQKNKQPNKQDHQMQNANKRPRTSTPTGPTPHPISFAGPSLPRPVILPTPTPYGLVNLAPAYGGPSVGSYGFPGAPLEYPQDPNMSGAHLYPPLPYTRPPFR